MDTSSILPENPNRLDESQSGLNYPNNMIAWFSSKYKHNVSNWEKGKKVKKLFRN